MTIMTSAKIDSVLINKVIINTVAVNVYYQLSID